MILPKIIGLNGVARAGKDTVATVLQDLYGYKIFSFSETLNDALYTLDRESGPNAGFYVKKETPDDVRWVRYADLVDEVGYEQAKEFPGVRAALQVMGTEVGRNLLGENVWVDALFHKIGDERAVITNVRFPNEYTKVKSRRGVVWRVQRPGFEPALGHISDTALDTHTFDEVIENDGTIEDLTRKVIRICNANHYAMNYTPGRV